MTRKFDCHSVASFSPPVVGKVPSKGKEVTRFRQVPSKGSGSKGSRFRQGSGTKGSRFRFKRFKVQTRFRFKRVQVQGSGSKVSRFRQGSGSKGFRFKVQVQKFQGSGSKGSRFRQGCFKRQRSEKTICMNLWYLFKTFYENIM